MNLRSSDSLAIVTGSATTVDVNVAYTDRGGGIAPGMGGNTSTAITTATTTTVLVGPTGSYVNRDIESISIANKDTSSNTVTVRIVDTGGSDGTAATVQVYKVVLDAGDTAYWNPRDGWETATALTLGVQNSTVITSDVVNNNGSADTIADVTGLSFAVLSGKKYWFRFQIAYTSAATTTGSRWSISGPSTPTTLNYTSEYSLTATSSTKNYATAYDIPAAANATSLTAGNVAVIEGFITPSADGTVIARFASEVSASAITALAGSRVTWTRVA